MPAMRSLFIGFLSLMLVGCGQLVSEKLTVSRNLQSEACPATKKLVIMPLADYSGADDPYMASLRNQIIMENLVDRLVSQGYQMPPQEDLVQYLVQEKYLSVDSGLSTQLSKDLQNSDWSAEMKNEISRIASLEKQEASTKNAHALDNKSLAKIAGAFNAKYVMRGRIIKFEMSEDTTWNPMRKGFIPVIIGGTDRALFGFANSESYDILDQMTTGGALGTLANRTYANSINATPSISSSSAAAAGAGIGLLAYNSGNTDAATVQLRLWVQSADTGQVVWTNRAEVKVKAQTVFANGDPGKLYEIAVEQAVRTLISDYTMKTASLQ